MDAVAIVITGSPGAGKSSVLEKLCTLLEIEGVTFGALESEQLGWGWPALHGAPWLAQVSAVIGLQRDAGRRLFLLAVTAESSEDLAAFRTALGVDRTIAVLLLAPGDVVADRVMRREPDTWPGKQPLVAHARALAASTPYLTGVDIRLNTDGRDPLAVATELREALRAPAFLGD